MSQDGLAFTSEHQHWKSIKTYEMFLGKKCGNFHSFKNGYHRIVTRPCLLLQIILKIKKKKNLL